MVRRGLWLALAWVLLCAGGAWGQSTVVVLVRHGEEVEPDGVDSPLSAAGVARADSLVAALRHLRLGAVYSTQYRRTRDMGAVMARAQGVPHHVVEAVRPAAAWLEPLAARLRSAHAGEAVLVVGHSNSTPLLIRALGGPALPPLDESEHARLFVLLLEPDGSVRLLDTRYGAR